MARSSEFQQLSEDFEKTLERNFVTFWQLLVEWKAPLYSVVFEFNCAIIEMTFTLTHSEKRNGVDNLRDVKPGSPALY